MRFPSEKELAMLREKYPTGTMVRLVAMNDKFAPPVGTIGEVAIIDDAGNIHMKWNNGRTLALIEGVDNFEVISDSTGGEK